MGQQITFPCHHGPIHSPPVPENRPAVRRLLAMGLPHDASVLPARAGCQRLWGG